MLRFPSEMMKKLQKSKAYQDVQLGSKIEPDLNHKNKIKQSHCLPISINWSPNSNANYYFGTTRSMIGYSTIIQVTKFIIKKMLAYNIRVLTTPFSKMLKNVQC